MLDTLGVEFANLGEFCRVDVPRSSLLRRSFQLLMVC